SRLMAKAAMRVSDSFRSVFGDAAMMTQVRPVLAGQIANNGSYDGLGYLAARHLGGSHYLYGIAGAPYIDIADEGAALSEDQIFFDDDLAGGWRNSGYWGLSNDINYDIDVDPGYPTAEAMPKWGAIRRIVSGQ